MSEDKKTIYSREEVLKNCLDYFNNDSLSADVVINKYLLKDKNGNLLEKSPDDMHKRLAKEFARIEAKYLNPISEENLYYLFENFKYIIPQGSPMAGIGNDEQTVSLGNCFVVGNKADSYGGILQIDQEIVHLMKRRGGVGTDLSHIRPKGSSVNNAAISSTGVVPFMERYSNTTREVAQDGRRGALMLSIDIRHKDVEDFIDAKLELKKVTGANISVKLSNEFLECVSLGKTFSQQFPIDSKTPEIIKEIDPLPLWKKLVHNAWKTGEPGILLWDTIISESPADCYSEEGFETLTTNPCGEVPLSIGDSCRLLLINLYSYVMDPFTTKARFDFALFQNHVKIAQRLMDDIVDLEEEKILKILKKVESDPEDIKIKQTELDLWKKILSSLVIGRRTGLGITGEADMLAAMGFRYGTPQASDFSELVHSTMAYFALSSSVEMAKERGPFPIWDYKKEESNPFLNRLLQEEEDSNLRADYMEYGRRNIAMITQSPAGSVSILTQTSSGIEPVFSLSYIRRRKINPNDKSATTHFIDETGDHWEEYNVVHPKFQTWATINGHGDLTHLPKEKIEELIKISPYHLATANEIDAIEKARMIGRIQKYNDHACSVTYNLPETATEGDVEDILLEAWRSGCKGITVYRDKCRSGVLVNHTAEEENKINIFKENHAPKRGKSLPCDIIRFSNKGEKWIGFLGLLDNKPYEVFTGPQDVVPIPSSISSGEIVKDKAPDGSKNIYNLRWVDKDGFTQEFKGLSRAFNREYWNIGRLISGILRHGMPIPNVLQLIDSLEIDGSESLTNWKNGVKRMLKKYIADGTRVKGEVCPECGSSHIVFKEGCLGCSDCGWSKCG